jgi:hypothetical protein
VTPLTAGGEPTGQVTFGVNGNLVSVKHLDSTGQASTEYLKADNIAPLFDGELDSFSVCRCT